MTAWKHGRTRWIRLRMRIALGAKHLGLWIDRKVWPSAGDGGGA